MDWIEGAETVSKAHAINLTICNLADTKSSTEEGREELLHCFSDESKGPLDHPTRVKNDGTKNGTVKRDQKSVSGFRFCQVAGESQEEKISQEFINQGYIFGVTVIPWNHYQN